MNKLPLNGMVFCFTGTLRSMNRTRARQLVTQLGGRNTEQITACLHSANELKASARRSSLSLYTGLRPSKVYQYTHPAVPPQPRALPRNQATAYRVAHTTRRE